MCGCTASDGHVSQTVPCDFTCCPKNCKYCLNNSCTTCDDGYDLKNGSCVAKDSALPDSGSDNDDTETAADTNTIAGNCPTGTTKSADGCCCMPN